MKNIVKPADRTRALVAERNRKMAQSAHAYVRGSTKRFYAWLQGSDHVELPSGPAVWICGDCHTGNLGPVANSNGMLAVQMRDLDQTVIGNPAHDIIRLALSLAMAARSADLPGVATALMLERIMEGYALAFSGPAVVDNEVDIVTVPKTIRLLMRRAAGRSWKNLSDQGLSTSHRILPIGKRFWPLTTDERIAVEDMFETQEMRAFIGSLGSSTDSARIRLIDTAYWKKGCSSLGRVRIAALLQCGKPSSERYCLIDVKEAVKATAPSHPAAIMPDDDAQRVVEGAKHLAPYLGERMYATKLMTKSVVIRELTPQDLKIEIGTLSRSEGEDVARYLAYTVGLGHARQLDTRQRLHWLGELKRNRTRSLEAPSWLWTAVVELIATHEAAYLEHCRRYALEAA